MGGDYRRPPARNLTMPIALPPHGTSTLSPHPAPSPLPGPYRERGIGSTAASTSSPARSLCRGRVRTYSQETRSTVERRMREILDGVTRANGASYEMKYQKNAPATINNPALTQEVRPLVERIVGAGNVKIVEPTMGGEDFGYFAEQVPGFYYRLGVLKPGTESGGLHTPTFPADDSAVPVGLRTMSRLLVDYLASQKSH